MAGKRFEDEGFDAAVTFTLREYPLPADLRPTWRLCLLTMLIDQCWNGQASLEQLHVLNWAVRTNASRESFLDFIHGRRLPNQILVRLDPSLPRAIEFALYEGLLERQATAFSTPAKPPKYRLGLAPKGSRVLAEIQKMDDCFSVEKQFFKSIGHKVSRAEIRGLFNRSK